MKLQTIFPNFELFCNNCMTISANHTNINSAKKYNITSTISLRAVSQPKLKSEPGTLLLMVAGMTTIGIQNSGYLPLASYSCTRLWYASNPPTSSSECSLYSRNRAAIWMGVRRLDTIRIFNSMRFVEYWHHEYETGNMLLPLFCQR